MEQFKKITFCILAIYILFGCNSRAQDNIQKVSNEKFAEIIKQPDVIIIDVRTLDEVKNGKIKNSININFYDNNFAEQIDKLDKRKKVAIYCASGVRSAKASKLLKNKGFKEIFDLSDGFKGWEKEGYPNIR